MINQYEKGSLEAINGHCKTKHSIYGERIFENRIVNSYHNYGIYKNNLGLNLKPLAYAFDGSIEAIQHLENPWIAIMWHPERDKIINQSDVELIKKHFNKN